MTEHFGEKMPHSSHWRLNGIKLSCGVIASGAKQSLFSAEIASSQALLAKTGIP
jgi:hypothetical protein